MVTDGKDRINNSNIVIESFHNKLIDFLKKINIEHILAIVMLLNLISFPFPHLLFLGFEKFARIARGLNIRIFEQGLFHQADIFSGVGGWLKFEVFYSITINSGSFGDFGINHRRQYIPVVLTLEDVLERLASTSAS